MTQQFEQTDHVKRSEGRHLFGLDPGSYDDVRPGYPSWIFEKLTDTGALATGIATLEIGPGTGLATRGLIELGANPLTLVEPDKRFAQMLERATRQHPHCTIHHDSFEAVDLADNRFDLTVAATCFHWIEPVTGFAKIRRTLNRGGVVALIWNVLQVLGKDDPFHDATTSLLAPLSASPSGAPDSLPFGLDQDARAHDARQAGFSEVDYEETRWSYSLSTTQVGKLYEGFSQVQRMPERGRNELLEQLMQIADSDFGGKVERNVTSVMYLIS